MVVNLKPAFLGREVIPVGQQEGFLPLRSHAWAGPGLAKVSGGHRAWK